MNAAHEDALQTLRHRVRDRSAGATCLGFGPRFLHSTGQAYKGGPNSGVFLQVTCDDAKDVPVPGQKYTFGIVKAAQARGDFRCWPTANAARCACIWARMCAAGPARALGYEGHRCRSALSKNCADLAVTGRLVRCSSE